MKNLSIIVLTIVCVLRSVSMSFAQDISKLLECSSPASLVEYKKWITNNKIQPATVSANLNRQLPKLILGENHECIFDPILEFGDNNTIEYFSDRASHPYKDDREGYASDLYILLRSRSKTFSRINEFQSTLKSLKRTVSIEYFLEQHLQNLEFRSQMELMKGIVEQNILRGQYAYEIPVLMKTIYKENPVAYDKYIAGMKVVPEEFTCFKNETCP